MIRHPAAGAAGLLVDAAARLHQIAFAGAVMRHDPERGSATGQQHAKQKQKEYVHRDTRIRELP
jgi:hypothetical protein